MSLTLRRCEGEGATSIRAFGASGAHQILLESLTPALLRFCNWGLGFFGLLRAWLGRKPAHCLGLRVLRPQPLSAATPYTLRSSQKASTAPEAKKPPQRKSVLSTTNSLRSTDMKDPFLGILD